MSRGISVSPHAAGAQADRAAAASFCSTVCRLGTASRRTEAAEDWRASSGSAPAPQPASYTNYALCATVALTMYLLH
jgi:hypothetical protein